MVDHVLHALWIQTVVLSVAVAIVATLRGPLMRRFGAEAAYLVWALPALAMLGVALPRRPHEATSLPAAIGRLVPAWSQSTPHVASSRGLALGAMLFATWALVAIAMLLLVQWRQRRFLAQLSTTWRLPSGHGPVVLGVLRPRIVLPVDFEERFDPAERSLMLAHEAVHQSRRDNAWNLVGYIIVVAHWFNPLAWLAWRWMRFDQELSCDAAVLGDVGSQPVRAYASALLKVQGVSLRPPLATSWQSTHPLVERVRMLNLHNLSSSNRRTGRRLVGLAIVLTVVVAYASQPQAETVPGSYTTFVDDGRVNTSVTLAVDGWPPSHVVRPLGALEGHIQFQPQPEVGLNDWLSARIAVKSLGDERVLISTVLTDDTTSTDLGKPAVIARMGEAARIDVASPDGAHTFSITYVSQPSARQNR